jgi:hypothetical protein
MSKGRQPKIFRSAEEVLEAYLPERPDDGGGTLDESAAKQVVAAMLESIRQRQSRRNRSKAPA